MEGGSESETMTVVNVSILKSYNKVIFRYSSVYIRRSVGLLEVEEKRTHSSSYQLILSSINMFSRCDS